MTFDWLKMRSGVGVVKGVGAEMQFNEATPFYGNDWPRKVTVHACKSAGIQLSLVDRFCTYTCNSYWNFSQHSKTAFSHAARIN